MNAHARPLALYIFSDHRSTIGHVLARTTSGNVTINDTLLHYVQDDLPFGGVGPSGMGAYHGEEGFKSLSHVKGVFTKWNSDACALRPDDRSRPQLHASVKKPELHSSYPLHRRSQEIVNGARILAAPARGAA